MRPTTTLTRIRAAVYTFTSPMNGHAFRLGYNCQPEHGQRRILFAGGSRTVWSTMSPAAAAPARSTATWRGSVISRRSSYQAFMYYPGELYNYGSVVGGAQPGASLTMTTTGISASRRDGHHLHCDDPVRQRELEHVHRQQQRERRPQHPGQRRRRRHGHPVGAGSKLAVDSRDRDLDGNQCVTPAKPSSSRWWRTNFLEGPGSTQQWQVPTIGFANATLTSTTTGSASGRSQRSDGHRRLFEPDQPELDRQLEQRDRLQD